MAPSDIDLNEPEFPVGRLIASMFKFKFEPKRATETWYARVWECVGTTNDFRRTNEEPAGIVKWKKPIGKPKWNSDDIFWIKIGSKWISSNSDDMIFARAYPITEAEYGTDIAFRLFKKLKITRRPIRTWYKINRTLVRKWNAFGAVFSVIMLSYSTNQMGGGELRAWADGGGLNGWAIFGMFMAVWAVVSIVWMCKTINSES